MKISKYMYASIIFFLTETMFLHIGLNDILKTGNIYSALFGSIISFIPIFFILKIKPNRFIKILLVILLSIYFIYTLYLIKIYVQDKYLDATPSFIIILMFLLPISYIKDIKTISKVSFILFIITSITIIFSFINLFPSIEIDNFKPVNPNITNIIIGSIKYMFYFVSPSIMLVFIPKNEISNKSIMLFYILSMIHILILFILIIGIFGIDLSINFTYPEYSLMKKINYFDFIQHIENIIAAEWLYSIFISCVMSIYSIKKGIS